MKHAKKILAWILATATIFALSVTAVFAGEIMPFATNAQFSMKPPVIGQTVKEVNSTAKVIIPDGAKEAGFGIEKIYWAPDILLPTALPSGEVKGRIEMGINGLEQDGKAVATMSDGDTFVQGKHYLVIFEVSSTKGILGEGSEIHLNGKDMVYEGFADQEHTGVTMLFAAEFVPTDKEKPQAVFSATGYNSGELGNIDATMQYSLDGVNWINCGSERVTLTGISEGTIDVRYANSTANVQTINIGRREVPYGITATNCTTTDNNNGKISGLKQKMEYRLSTSSDYITVPTAEITGLVPGTYCIRNKADGTYLASGDTTVTISAYKADLPKITTQPKSVTIDTGSDATFTIEATGEKITYEWHYIDYKKNTEKVIEKDSKYFKGQGTNTLKVLSVNKMGTDEFDCEYDKDQFYCVVSNPTGKVISNVVVYNVNHVAGKEWKNDSKYHWQVCVCGNILNKAEHVDADKDGKCDVCKYDLSNTREYFILSGEDAKWTKGSIDGLVFTCDGKADDLKEVLVDDKALKSDEYGCITDEKTKTLVISLPAEYLEGLTTNAHTLIIRFADGAVGTQFTIADDSSKDPDPTPVTPTFTTLTWILIAIGAAAVIVIIILVIVLVKGKKTKK